MSATKSQIVFDGAERLHLARKDHKAQLCKTIVENYAKQLASASPEEKRALEEQMHRELEEKMKHVAPSRYALYSAQ
jgi:hypothetical protein